MTIVNKIGDIAREQGITKILHFAEKTGLAYNTAHDLYTGRATRIGIEVLDKVCRVLKVQPGELLVWKEDSSTEILRD